MSIPRPAHLVALLVSITVLAVGGVACSDGDDDPLSSDPEATTAGPAGEDEEGPDPSVAGRSTGGSASLTIDETTWDFGQVNCAFGEDEIGIEGATWNMAARDGSLSLYAAIDPDATYIELADLDDMEATNLMASGDVELEIDGKQVSGNGTFFDVNGDGGLELVGRIEVLCP